MEKLIITIATTGSGTPLSKCPNLAITPAQIADEVYECYQAGASVAHIHVRDEDGGRSMDFDRFKETVERIRDKCDILINLTTSGMEFSEEVRLKPLSLKPDLASFNAGSMNFGENVFVNTESMMKRFAQAMEYVDARKQQRIRLTAQQWLAQQTDDPQVRFDVVEVYPGGRVRHIENAFQ